MLPRHIRSAGVSLIETALAKLAFVQIAPIQAPSIATLQAKKTRELGAHSTATAAIPKVVNAPTT